MALSVLGFFLLAFAVLENGDDKSKVVQSVPESEFLEDDVLMLEIASRGDYIYEYQKPFFVQKLSEFASMTGLSLTLWMYPLRYTETNELLTLFTTEEVMGDDLRLFLKNKKLAGVFSDSSISVQPPELKWSFLSVVCNGSDASIYYNGEFVISKKREVKLSALKSDTNLAVGADGTVFNPFSGYLADVTVYNSVLEDDDIKKIYKGKKITKKGGKLKNPVRDAMVKNMSMSIFKTHGEEENDFSILLNRDLETSIKFDEIGPYILNIKQTSNKAYISVNEVLNYTEASTVCQRFNGSLPFSDSQTVEDIINYFSIHKVMASSSWVNNGGGSSCYVGYLYQGVFKVSAAKCSSVSEFICEINAENNYRILGYNDTEDYNFRLSYQDGMLTFNSLKDYTIEIQPLQITYRSFQRPHLDVQRKFSSYLNLFGRHLWKIGKGDDDHEYVKMTLTSCNNDEFTCNNGMCVNLKKVCDMNMDCSDSSDEWVCSPAIPPNSKMYFKEYSPSYGTNKMTVVNATLKMERFIKLDLTENKVELALNLETSWCDSRLNYKFLPPGIYKNLHKKDLKQMWLPDIKLSGVNYDIVDKLSVLENKKDLQVVTSNEGYQTVQESFEAMLNNGKDVKIIHQSTELITLICSMELLYFPFDIQVCSMRLKLSGQMYDDAVWGSITSGVEPQVAATLFEIYAFHFEASSSKETDAVMTLILRRKYGAYVLNTFLPCLILEFIGLLTAIFPLQDFTNRMTVTLSCLIVMAALFTQVSTMLPESAEPKFIDIWLFVHVVILFLFFFIHVIVNYMLERKLRKKNIIAVGDRNKKWKTMQAFLQLDKLDIDEPPACGSLGPPPKLSEADWKRLYLVNYGGAIVCFIIYIIFCIAFTQIGPEIPEYVVNK